MLERFGFRVKQLVRVRIGNLRMGDLPRGHWRLLTRRDLNAVIPSGVEGSRDGNLKVRHRDSSTSKSFGARND
jgi:hypothetical protein